MRGHIPGKDGIHASSLLVEAVAASGKRLSELYADIVARYGELVMVEIAYGFTSERHAELEERTSAPAIFPPSPRTWSASPGRTAARSTSQAAAG